MNSNVLRRVTQIESERVRCYLLVLSAASNQRMLWLTGDLDDRIRASVSYIRIPHSVDVVLVELALSTRSIGQLTDIVMFAR